MKVSFGIVLAAELRGDILIKSPAEIDIQGLEAAADAEYGLFPLKKGRNQLPFQGIALCVLTETVTVRLLAIEPGIDIPSSA
jgi:hypothetical protein